MVSKVSEITIDDVANYIRATEIEGKGVYHLRIAPL